MFYGRKVLVILQLLIVLPFATNELWTKAKVKVNANAIRPFLHIERPNITHLMITQPRQPHYLACNATIEPSYYHSDTQYYFTWYRNDNSLHLNDFIIYRNGTLRLPPKEKATGVYRCKINADTNAVISESITVEYPVLRKLRTSVNYTATVGLPLTLNCPIQSIPPANISWYYGNVSLSKVFKDNRRVNEASPYAWAITKREGFSLPRNNGCVCYLILSNGSLVLRSVQLSQAGKFKCLAYNLYALKAHHRQFIITVHVVDKRPGEKVSSRNDELLPPLQDALLYVPLNGDLNLSCSTVNDNVAIEWWFQHNTTSPLVKLLNNSREYHIRSSIEEYEGNYTCRTTTDKQTFRIIVTKPPLIVKDLPVDEANIASSKTFSCLADGNPPPMISWYHNGEPFNSSYTRYINANQLHIPSFDPQESGIYQCFARNIAGEVYTAGELRLRNQSEVINNPLKNIKCYPHTFNSINVTFENQASESLYIVYLVHIGVSEPFRWMSPYPPMKLNASYVIIELPHVENLPYIRPFQIITRVLIPTSDIRISNKPQQQTVLSTLRSLPVTCCTQGLPSRFIHIGNDTFVTWSVPDLATKKYFIIQFVINQTSPNPEELRRQSLNGTVQHINLTQEDIMRKLQTIEVVNYTETKRVLQNALSNYRNNSNSNEVNNAPMEAAEEIFSLVIPAHITGIMLRNFTRLKLRVLVITAENEHLAQDYRYVEWKMMENDTDAVWTAPYRLTIIESRMLRFHFDDNLSERCVLICYIQIHYPRLLRGERKCEQRNISGEDHSQLEIRTLKPTTHYSLHFSSCDAKIFYGQYDVVTLPDPPGPISNQRVTRHNGLKLSWDPPLQPNGKIHHYNILWSLGNVTHEANVFECSICYYKFPNISETAKINVSVRVVGETGVGAPIYIDLRNIDHRSLENEISNTNSDIYTGIAVGCFLSILCIFTFAILIMVQRKRFMARQQGPSHLRTITDINFGNLSNTSMAADNIGSVGGGGGGGGVGLTTNTMPTDCHEMQTLIPRLTGRPTNILSATSIVQHLPNGHTNTNRSKNKNKITNDKETINTTILSEFEMISDHNMSVVPLYKSSPLPKIKHVVVSQEVHSKPFFIPFKNPPTHHIMAIQQHKQSSFSSVVNKPPSSLPFAASPLEVAAYDACGGGDSRARRSNSLSSNSNGSSSASSSHKSKQFHTNFPKHAKSIDGICLLAEEESASTGITPTSDIDIHVELYNNSDNAFKKRTTQQKTVKPEQGVSNKQQQQQQSSKLKSKNNSNKEKHKKITTTTTTSTTTTIAIITPTSTNTAMDSEYNEKEKCYLEPIAAPATTITATKANLYTSNAAILLNTATKLPDTHYQPPDMDPNG